MIYVISDGKDMRSKASVREVIRFLQGNQETVYGTMVGDAATWGIGYLDRVHVPLIPAEMCCRVMPMQPAACWRRSSPPTAWSAALPLIAKEIRTQYTLGYYSHLPTIDGRYRTLDVHVERPNLDVEARSGLLPDSFFAVMARDWRGGADGHRCAEPGFGGDLGHERFCGRHRARRLPSLGGGDPVAFAESGAAGVAGADPRVGMAGYAIGMYGALAGVACGTGVMVLYKALALGGMGLTAAVSGVLAAVLPVLWAFSTEGCRAYRSLRGLCWRQWRSG